MVMKFFLLYYEGLLEVLGLIKEKKLMRYHQRVEDTRCNASFAKRLVTIKEATLLTLLAFVEVLTLRYMFLTFDDNYIPINFFILFVVRLNVI